MAMLCAVVTFGAYALETPQRALACDCAPLTDAEAYEFADVVFTGTLVEIDTPEGDIIVSTDPERFVFDVDRVFKGEAQTRQSVVTAREGASWDSRSAAQARSSCSPASTPTALPTER
jgi:hypothetical protein